MSNGDITPQRESVGRNMDQRQTNVNAYEEYARLNMPQGNQRRQELQEMENEFLDERHYDANLPHQSADAGFSERGRLVEVTGPYIDQVLERYVGRVAEVENARIERKHGTGTIGRMRRWFSETAAGNRTRFGGKIVLGSLAHAASVAAPIFAPALNYAGTRLVVDGLIEAVQKEGFEIPRLERLNQLRLGRHYWIRELMRIRNELSEQSPVGDPYARTNIAGTAVASAPAATAAVGAPGIAGAMDSGGHWDAQENNMAFPGPAGFPSAEFIDAGTTLDRRLEIIVEQLDLFEEQIQRTEQEVQNIRRIGRWIRTGAGAVITAGYIYEMFTNGLSMGIQDFDGNDVSHKVVLRGQEFFTGRGVNFIYSTGTQLASHTVGSVAPWAKIGATAAGLAVGMLGSTANDLIAMRRDTAEYHREQASATNPDDQAVLSFKETPRTAHGGASGVHHEIEHTATTATTREREEMNERKQKMVSGSLWNIPDTSLDPAIVTSLTGNELRNASGNLIYQVIRWEGQGLVFSFVMTNSMSDIDANGLIIKGRNKAVNADRMIMDSNYEAPSLSATTPEAKIDDFLNKRAEDLGTSQHREVKTSLTINGHNIPVGNYLEITRPIGNKSQIIVRELHGSSQVWEERFDQTNLNELEQIFNNTQKLTGGLTEAISGKEKEANKKSLQEINSILKIHNPSNKDIKPKQFFKLSPDKWVLINVVNDDAPGGQIVYKIGDNFAAIDAAPPREKKKKIESAQETDLESIETKSFSEFKDWANQKDSAGVNYEHLLIDQGYTA